MYIKILAPSLGDSDEITGVIANILVKEGDTIAVDDILLECLMIGKINFSIIKL